MDYMVSCGRGASASASWCSAIKSLKGSAAFKISKATSYIFGFQKEIISVQGYFQKKN